MVVFQIEQVGMTVKTLDTEQEMILTAIGIMKGESFQPLVWMEDGLERVSPDVALCSDGTKVIDLSLDMCLDMLADIEKRTPLATLDSFVYQLLPGDGREVLKPRHDFVHNIFN